MPTSEPSLLAGLEKHLYASQPMVVAFKGSQHPADTRYLIGCSHQQPPNRARRGVQPTSRLPVYCKSEWGYLVKPHTQTEADAFSPTGRPNVLWAVELSSITAATSTITITPSGAIPDELDGLDVLKSAASMTLTWGGARPPKMLIVPSPPFRRYRPHNADGSLADSSLAPNRSGTLPNYLQPGQHYSVSATNATASIVWLENHTRPA